jgi:hypothetical protein
MRYKNNQDIALNAIFIVIISLAICYWVYIGTRNNTTKVVDGCEYIRTYNGHGWNLTHKGNCTNIIHYKK